VRRTTTILAVVLIGTGFSLSAQETGPRVTVFASGLEYVADGSELSGGVGVALSYRWASPFGVELSTTSQKYRGDAVGTPGNTGLLIREIVRSEPVDVVAQYHFARGGRWKPYAGAGVHYLDARGAESSFHPQVNGGVFYSLTPHLALRLDGRYVIGNRTAFHDPAFKPSAGMSLRF
jgi:opacity protein-like surface antigen